MLTTTATATAASDLLRPQDERLRAWHGVAWVLAGVLLCLGLGGPLNRTQEARVLEVAREMLGAGWHEWMIPHAAGLERLHKPPLAYWLSAASFTIFGVSEWAGRLPTVLASWLLLGVVLWGARWLYGTTAGCLAACGLLGCMLFVRFARQAETDPLSLLFTTAATLCLWRAATAGHGASAGEAPPAGREFWAPGWYHAAGALLGLATIAKGPQAAFPVLFFVAFVAYTRRWALLGRLVLSGAPLTFALVAAPWWVYLFATRGFAKTLEELFVATAGTNHGGWFVKYFWILAYGTLPWVALLTAGVVTAVKEWTLDARARGLLLWAGTILLPLCVIGNKQPQYVLPLLPPLAILAGWVVARALSGGEPDDFRRAMRRITLWTLIAGAALAPAFLIAPRIMGHGLRAIDLLLAGALVAGATAGLLLYVRRGWRSALRALAPGLSLAGVVATSVWVPSLTAAQTRRYHAALVAEAGAGPACFYGPWPSLDACFVLRRVVPMVGDEQALRALLEREPRTLVIVPDLQKQPVPVPAWLGEARRVRHEEDIIGFYRLIPR